MTSPSNADLTPQEIDLITEFRQLTDLGRANLVSFLKQRIQAPMSSALEGNLTQQESELITMFRLMTDPQRERMVEFLQIGREETEKLRREIEDEGPNPYDE